MVHAEHARKLALLEAEVALLRLEFEGRDIARASGGLLPALLRLLLPVALAVAGAWGLPAFLRCVERKLAERHEGAAARGDLRRQALYRLDLWFSTNPYSKMQALAALAAALVVAGALLLFAVSDTTPTDALWESLAGVGIAWDWASAAGRLDPGSARGVLTRVVAVAVSLGGMFVTALLLGIVSEQITEKVSHRAGKESEIPNFKGSYLGRFSLVSADFWTSDHLLERSRSMDAFSGTRAEHSLFLPRSSTTARASPTFSNPATRSS
jgi:hypothetical protein